MKEYIKKRNIPDPMVCSLKFLSHRDRTEYEVSKKLESAGIQTEQILQTVEKLKQLGYLNDREYCRRWIESHRNKKPVGKRYAAGKLRMAGISKDIIEEVIGDYFSGEEELLMAITLLRKRLNRERSLDEKGRARFFRYLTGRGFSRTAALKALDTVISER